jgi:hypothetical protein
MPFAALHGRVRLHVPEPRDRMLEPVGVRMRLREDARLRGGILHAKPQAARQGDEPDHREGRNDVFCSGGHEWLVNGASVIDS